MNNLEVFYNQEDLWLPQQVNDGKEQPIEPYYITMRIPQEQSQEFALILPFTKKYVNSTVYKIDNPGN